MRRNQCISCLTVREDNGSAVVTLAMCHRLHSIPQLLAEGLSTGD